MVTDRKFGNEFYDNHVTLIGDNNFNILYSNHECLQKLCDILHLICCCILCYVQKEPEFTHNTQRKKLKQFLMAIKL